MLQTGKWLTEVYKDSALSFKYEKILFEKQSPYQKIQIIDTEKYGKILINDGYVMTCVADEYCYHEMIAHVPLFTHPNPRSVLVIGGGDGGTVREVLKHPSVEECVMVEIDEMVVDAARSHLPELSSELDNPKLKLIFEDGVEFVKNKSELFDVAIIDSSDPVGPGKLLFEKDFYKNLSNCLKKDGLMVAQSESHFYDLDFQEKLIRDAKEFFPQRSFYYYNNLTYPSGYWSFLFCSKKYMPTKLKQPLTEFKFKYFTEELHLSSFASPQFVKDALKDLQTF